MLLVRGFPVQERVVVPPLEEAHGGGAVFPAGLPDEASSMAAMLDELYAGEAPITEADLEAMAADESPRMIPA